MRDFILSVDDFIWAIDDFIWVAVILFE
jgi:hypothetical protein